MKIRHLSLCGMIAPVLFVFIVILGGALRPGYIHLSETMSELFSPGSPNKVILDTLHTFYAVLLILFGFGILLFVQRQNASKRIGKSGAILYIVMGVLSITTATVFPQDPWGSPPTFPGEMHKIMSGILSIVSMLSMLLLGVWSNRAKIFPGFGTHSFVTIILVILSAVWFAASLESQIMGLTERITALVGFQWTFTLALYIYKKEK